MATKTKIAPELETQLTETWEAMKALTGKNPQPFRIHDEWAVEVVGCIRVSNEKRSAVIASGPTIADAVLNAWANLTHLEEGQYLMVQRRALVWAGGMVGFVPADVPKRPRARRELGDDIPFDDDPLAVDGDEEFDAEHDDEVSS